MVLTSSAPPSIESITIYAGVNLPRTFRHRNDGVRRDLAFDLDDDPCHRDPYSDLRELPRQDLVNLLPELRSSPSPLVSAVSAASATSISTPIPLRAPIDFDSVSDESCCDPIIAVDVGVHLI